MTAMDGTPKRINTNRGHTNSYLNINYYGSCREVVNSLAFRHLWPCDTNQQTTSKLVGWLGTNDANLRNSWEITRCQRVNESVLYVINHPPSCWRIRSEPQSLGRSAYLFQQVYVAAAAWNPVLVPSARRTTSCIATGLNIATVNKHTFWTHLNLPGDTLPMGQSGAELYAIILGLLIWLRSGLRASSNPLMMSRDLGSGVMKRWITTYNRFTKSVHWSMHGLF